MFVCYEIKSLYATPLHIGRKRSCISTVVLCLINNYTMKTCEGAEVQLHALLTSPLNGCEWSALPLRKEPPVLIG
jgi:hypothetical protein